MSDGDGTCCNRGDVPTGPWGPGSQRRKPQDQVAYSERGGGFAFRPKHIHCHDKRSATIAKRYLEETLGLEVDHDVVNGTGTGTDADLLAHPSDDSGSTGKYDQEVENPGAVDGDVTVDGEVIDGEVIDDIPAEYLFTLADDTTIDVEFIIDELRDRHCRCEVNYVVFNDAGPSGDGCGCGCGCGFGGSPIYGSPIYASPIYASAVSASGQFAQPVYASPVYASPVYGSPIYGSPIYGSTFKSEGLRSNSARPVAKPVFTTFKLPNETKIRAIVLDTGIADPKWRPGILGGVDDGCGDCCFDPPDRDNDKWLDPASGHGTFIAGIIEQLAPEQDLHVRRVLSSFGDGDIARDIVPMLYCLIRSGLLGPDTVLNLSFGGYADAEMKSLARAIRRVQRTGAVVVASAGNDGTCRPTYPACLPGVVGVGALDDHGPAPYSNHGPWVRACAPGTDLISTFYKATKLHPLDVNLPVPPLPGNGAPEGYQGWARWTGTSFAAPIVAAALVRHMSLTGSTAMGAVEAVIDAPGLFRLPMLGTVVNMITPTPHETQP